jgi:hypothetical protein
MAIHSNSYNSEKKRENINMDKVSQTKIIKLELLRLRTIIYELTNSSYKDLTPEEISTYIDNLNRSITRGEVNHSNK